LNKSLFFLVSLFLFGCAEKPLGEHGFTKTDIEQGVLAVKLKYKDGTTKIVSRINGISACNIFGDGYMHALRDTFSIENIKVKDYVCCYEKKDPECKYELR